MSYLVVPCLTWLFAIRKGKQLLALRKEWQNYRLGFAGERYIGIELNQLCAHGYRVYHDFLFDMKPGGEKSNFNIDHIVIGPAGVFAIETKCWSKPKGEHVPRNTSGTIIYRDKVLVKPDGNWDKTAIEQTYKHSKALAEWLGEAILWKQSVQPVLVFPGWLVKLEHRPPFQILAGSLLCDVIKEMPHCGLSDDRLAAIADRVEAHCRNLDFS